MARIINYIKLHKLVSVILLIVVVLGGYYWYKKAHATTAQTQYITEAAAKGTVTVSVTGTGQVSDQNKIDLKPGSSGAVTQLYVKQGDTVKAGQLIAEVDEKNNIISLNQARASVASAQANYDKVVAGALPTDVETAQASLNSAKAAVDNAKVSYDNTVKQQQLAVATAHANLLNAGLAATLAAGDTSTATITLSGAYGGTNEGSYTITLTQGGTTKIPFTVSGLENATGWATRGVAQPLGSSGLYFTISTDGNIIPNDYWTVQLPNPQASNYLTLFNAYQTALQTQSQSVSNAQTAITTAQNNLASAQAAFDAKTAPPTTSDVTQARAQLLNAQAQLQQAQNAYDNNIIKAPFDGVIAQLNVQKGDQLSSGGSTSASVIGTLITQEKLATISLNEVDVAKVKVGQPVNLTFDAIDGLNIVGHVAQVDAIGTVSQGVVSYTVQIGFDNQDDRIKSGMSVSASIIIDVKPDVLTVPNSAVKQNGNSAYVQMLDSKGQPQNVPVTTGVSNDDVTEITSGLKEGDKVVTQTITTGSTTTTQSNSGSGLRIPGVTGGGFGGGGFGGGARGGGTGR